MHSRTIGGLRDAVLTVPTVEPLIPDLMINLPRVIVFLGAQVDAAIAVCLSHNVVGMQPSP